MRSNPLFSLLLLFLFSLLGEAAEAQVVFQKKQSQPGMRVYRKLSRDSVKVPVKKRGDTAVKRAKGKSRVKAKKSRTAVVDSLRRSPKQYALGERVIMPGDSGKDVKSVAAILINKLYIDEKEVIYTSDGGVLYKGGMVRAVKHFQEFNGFYPDGIIGHALIKELRKKKD